MTIIHDVLGRTSPWIPDMGPNPPSTYHLDTKHVTYPPSFSSLLTSGGRHWRLVLTCLLEDLLLTGTDI